MSQAEPIFYWKHIRLGDFATKGETYSMAVGQYDAVEAGYTSAKKKINNGGANVDFGYSFSVSMIKDHHGSETESEFRSRVRQNLIDISDAAALRTSTESNLGPLSQTTAGATTTTANDESAGSAIEIECVDAAGFDALGVTNGDLVLIVDVNTPSICEVFTVQSVDDGADSVTATELVYPYTTGSTMIKVDWYQPATWPDAEIVYDSDQGAKSRFDARMSFRGADDWI